MPQDHELLPGPDPEPEKEQPEEREQPKGPDYRKFAGNPWWKRKWIQSYLFPAGVIAFAAILLITRTGSAVKSAYQEAASHEESVGNLRHSVHSNIRREIPRSTAPSVPPAGQDTATATQYRGGGDDYRQQLAEEKRRHRLEAFASPIFADNTPTGKVTQANQAPTIPDLSGADLSGLAPQQIAQLKRYLELQNQMLAPAAPTTQASPVANTPAIVPAANRDAQNAAEAQKNVALNRATGPFHKLFPGTIVEAALDTALEGSMTGVVLAHFTRDVHTNNLLGPVLIPAGTQLVGQAAPVTSLNAPRLKVAFDIAIEPNGYALNLDQFEAMAQNGNTGLADSVNNHWLRTIGIAAVVGVIEGAAELGTGVSILSPRTEIYQGIGAESGREGIRILDRFLNVPPTVKVNPGSRIRIVFPVGLDGVPEYRNTQMEANL